MLNYQKEIIEANVGYQDLIERFRYLLRKFGIDEKEVVDELADVLIEDTQDRLFSRLAEWLGRKVELLEAIEKYNIIDDLVKLEEVSYQKFRKEVDRHYEVVKRRQQRRNPG
jgi:predicted metalloendopeptidase